jgi:hypothetical protein
MLHIVARGAVAAAMLLTAACSGEMVPSSTSAPIGPFERAVAQAEPGRWRANGTDVVEVWVCHVPNGSTAAEYGGLPLRLPLAPALLASVFQQQVSRYFQTISHGRYSPFFTAGGEVALGAAEGSKECVDRALERSSAMGDVVLAVADAEQAPPGPGGFGSGGNVTAARRPAQATRRYAYVGGADFDRATWGDTPPLDLVEHELGHTLGWVHSGVSAAGEYLSALDLMSNSAAPRDTKPERRDGPDVLALHRVVSGWLPIADVVVAQGRTTVKLATSTGDSGTRLLVLPVDDTHFLTVERLPADGFDDHLPQPGVAIHRVTVDAGAVTAFEPIGAAPFTALLQPGDAAVSDGWTVRVAPDGALTVTPT